MKKINLLTLTLIMLMFFTAKSYAQETKGTVDHVKSFVVMSLDEIVQYDRLHPSDSIPKLKNREDHNLYMEPPVDESKIIYTYDKKLEPVEAKTPMDSPPPDASFLGLGDEGSSIPPDVNAEVGPNHLMITLNTEVRIQTKTGDNLSTVSLSSFFSGLPGSSGTFDPRVEFEPFSRQWIVVCVAGSSGSSSRLFIAISETDDPTGNWYKYAIDTDPNNAGWMDYPNMGFNKKWLVVSGNMFSNGGSFQNNVYFVIKKSDLLNGLPNPQYTRIVSGTSFTVVPAVTYDTMVEDIYLISNINNMTTSFIGKFKITGDIGSEILQFQGYVNLNNTWRVAGTTSDFAPQLGSSHKISSGDSRMQNVIYRHGKLWGTHHVFLPANSPNRSAIQWFELDASSGAVLQFARVDEAGKHFTYPSIAVNAVEDILIGYSSFSTSQYASSSYSFRSGDDPVNTIQSRYEYKDGLASYYKTFGGGSNRWGDYSATDVDPDNDLDLWTLQEYAELPTGSTDHWGTWWAMLIREAAPVAAFSADQTTIAVGGAVNFTDESSFEPESWSWTFEGGTPGTSTEQNPVNIVYSATGEYNVSLTVTNTAGSNSITMTDYIEVSDVLLPDVQFTATDSVPCVGVTTHLIDQSLYSPSSWEWTITPGTFEFVEGTSATSQNPSIQFNEAGQYTVTLDATNSNGSSSNTKTDFINAGGYEMPFTEDFENEVLSNIGWSVENPDEGVTWDIRSVGGNTPGFMSAYMNLKEYLIVGERDGLISPPLNFMGYISMILNFQHAYAERISASSDSLIVYVSSDCGNSWVRVFEMTEDGDNSFATHESISQSSFVPETEDDWCNGSGAACYSIDLSEYAWQYDVRIKFESVSGIGNALYIDNISLDGITGMPDNAASADKIKIFPNPTTGEINVNISELEHAAELQVLSIQGKLVEKYTLQPATGLSKKLDLSNQPKGVYFIRVTNGEYNHVEKVILK
jgi:PKD repeat protein